MDDKGPQQQQQLVKFLIMFTRGGGSTWVQALLNKQQGFRCIRETLLTSVFFDSFDRTPEHIDKGIFFEGYKNKVKHVQEWAQQAIIKEGKKNKKSIRMVFLYRRDIVRNAIGNWRKGKLEEREISRGKLKAGMGNAYDESHVPPAFPIPLEDLKKELDYLRDNNKALVEFRDRLIKEGVEVLDIYYEDMLEDVEGVMKRVVTWITGSEDHYKNVEQKKDVPVPVKNTSNDLRDHVSNYEEVREFVQNHTDYTWIE